jgi:hypothetical protein
MNNNLKQIPKIKNKQYTIENLNILEIGQVTEITLGGQGTYFEKRTSGFYEPDCIIMKK